MATSVQGHLASNSTLIRTTQPGEGEGLRSLSPFLTLPPELHSLIAQELAYPDLLSLKLSHPYFQVLLRCKPTICNRIQWIERRSQMRLPVPRRTNLSFRSDVAFAANPEIQRILQQRLRHRECVYCKTARDAVVETMGRRAGRTFCFVLEGGICPRFGVPDEKEQQTYEKSSNTGIKWAQKVCTSMQWYVHGMVSGLDAGYDSKHFRGILWPGFLWVFIQATFLYLYYWQ